MALDPNKFTRKTQEAIGAAQAAGREAGHTEIAPEHILRALLDQPEGVVNGVLERIGVDLSAVRVRVDEALSRRPQVSGATVRDAALAQATFQILEAADKERTQLDDEYLSNGFLQPNFGMIESMYDRGLQWNFRARKSASCTTS